MSVALSSRERNEIARLLARPAAAGTGETASFGKLYARRGTIGSRREEEEEDKEPNKEGARYVSAFGGVRPFLMGRASRGKVRQREEAFPSERKVIHRQSHSPWSLFFSSSALAASPHCVLSALESGGPARSASFFEESLSPSLRRLPPPAVGGVSSSSLRRTRLFSFPSREKNVWPSAQGEWKVVHWGAMRGADFLLPVSLDVLNECLVPLQARRVCWMQIHPRRRSFLGEFDFGNSSPRVGCFLGGAGGVRGDEDAHRFSHRRALAAGNDDSTAAAAPAAVRSAGGVFVKSTRVFSADVYATSPLGRLLAVST